MEKIASSESEILVVILDLSTSPYIDSRGARFIKKLFHTLSDLNISFHVAEAHSEVRDILRIEGIEDLLGHISRKHSLHDIVETCIAEHIEKEKRIMQMMDPAHKADWK